MNWTNLLLGLPTLYTLITVAAELHELAAHLQLLGQLQQVRGYVVVYLRVDFLDVWGV